METQNEPLDCLNSSDESELTQASGMSVNDGSGHWCARGQSQFSSGSLTQPRPHRHPRRKHCGANACKLLISKVSQANLSPEWRVPAVHNIASCIEAHTHTQGVD